jgi:hypothetical protein
MTEQLPLESIVDALREVGRIASVMVDGDEATRIIDEQAMQAIAPPDPDYPFMTGDHYRVNHAAFLRTKKTLLRLQRLTEIPCCTALWVPVSGQKGQITLAVQNGSVHRYYTFGAQQVATPKEMDLCLTSGEPVVAPPDHASHTVTVLAPVFDSLGQAVGIVTLSALLPGLDRLAPAWS